MGTERKNTLFVQQWYLNSEDKGFKKKEEAGGSGGRGVGVYTKKALFQ